MSRVKDVPVYAQRVEEVDAALYNLWRRAKMHLTLPIPIPVPDQHGMVMLLEETE